MKEMTLNGLINMSKSYVGQCANYMVIVVQVGDNAPEIIVNPKENFESKIEYYKEAYNEDLTLKNNSIVKIVDYDFVDSFYLVNVDMDSK